MARGRKAAVCYVYVIKDGVTPLYVGKGTGRRGKISAARHGGDLVVLESNLTDDEAFKAEKRWIAELRPTNNKCAGGNGGRASKKSNPLPAWYRKMVREMEEVGSRVYVARFLLDRLNESNCEAWGVSKVDLNRLREVAHG